MMGDGIDRSKSHNGIQFKTVQGVSITLWKKPKEKESTIKIDGKEGYLNFAEIEMKNLYMSVKSKVGEKEPINDERGRKRKK